MTAWGELQLAHADTATAQLLSKIESARAGTRVRLTAPDGGTIALITRRPFAWEITALAIPSSEHWDAALRCGCCRVEAGRSRASARRWDLTCTRGRDRVLWRLLAHLKDEVRLTSVRVASLGSVEDREAKRSLAHTPPRDLKLSPRGPASWNYYDVNYHVGGE